MTVDLTQVHIHPLTLARLRERIAVTTEAARRAGGYLASAPCRPIAPTADAFPTDTDSLTLVLLQAGNVTTGASDPFGLWAAASPELRHQVSGADLADSWATDAHKWLNAHAVWRRGRCWRPAGARGSRSS